MMDSKTYADDILKLEKQLIEDANEKAPSGVYLDDQQFLSITLVACAAVLAREIAVAGHEVDLSIQGSTR